MLTFDPGPHKYYWDGEEIPGVTTILKDLRLTPPYPQTENALDLREAGSANHDILARYDWGMADQSEVLAIGNAGEQYLQLLADIQPRWTAIEQPVCVPDARFWYAGTMDRGGEIAARRAVADLKFTDGSAPDYTAIQVMAYGFARLGTGVLQSTGHAIRLRSKGSYKLTTYWDTEAAAEYLLGVWLSCLNVYNWKHKTAKKKGVPPQCLCLHSVAV